MIISVFLWIYGPFLFAYHVGFVRTDTITYFKLGQELMKGDIDTLMRTPGYPILLYVITTQFGPFGITIFQCLTYLVSVLLLYVALTQRYGSWMAAPALLAAALMMSSQLVLNLNLTLLTESLFMSGCILYVSYLILRSDKLTTIDFFVLSLISAVVFLIRNTGLIFVAVNCFLILSRRDLLKNLIRNSIVAVGPIAMVVALINANNFFSAGFFRTTVLSIGGDSFITAVLWRPTPELPEPVNELLQSIIPDTQSKDLERLRKTWNLAEIWRIGKEYSLKMDPKNSVYRFIFGPNEDIISLRVRVQRMAQVGYVLDLITSEAIRQNRLLYYKLTIANFYKYCCLHFTHYNRWSHDFLGDLNKDEFRKTEPLDSELGRALLDPDLDKDGMRFMLRSTNGQLTTNPGNALNQFVIRNMEVAKSIEMQAIWGFWALGVAGLSALGLLLARFGNERLHVIAVAAAIYGGYVLGMVIAGALYEVRSMAPAVPLNYFLCIVGTAILVREGYLYSCTSSRHA